MYLLNAIIRCVTGCLLIRHPDAGAAGVTMQLAALFIVGAFPRSRNQYDSVPQVGMDGV